MDAKHILPCVDTGQNEIKKARELDCGPSTIAVARPQKRYRATNTKAATWVNVVYSGTCTGYVLAASHSDTTEFEAVGDGGGIIYLHSILGWEPRLYIPSPFCFFVVPSSIHLDSNAKEKAHARWWGVVVYCRQLMMSTKAGFREAPPTRKPSMSASWLSSLQFFSLTEPP